MILKEALFFLLPLLLAGLVHHFVIIKNNFFPFFAYPIDFNRKLSNKPIFGTKKTFRGFIVVSILSGFFMWLLSAILNINLQYPAFIMGTLLGLGYSLGELPNSFVKRRIGITESERSRGITGALLYLLDHSDSIIGSVIVLLIIYDPSSELVFILFIVGIALHIVFDALLYKISYKKNLLKHQS